MTTKIAISQKTPGAYQQNRLQEIFRQIETQWNGGSANLEFLQSGTGAIARTLQSKERDIVSVKDFGASGDGVTDGQAALIQKAVDAVWVAGGGAVYIPAGHYLETGASATVTLRPFVEIYGDGFGSFLDFKKNVFFTKGMQPSVDQYGAYTWRVASAASAGDQTVTLTTPAQTSDFSVGGLAVLRSVAEDATNFPAFIELVKIIAINAGTGVLTLEEPLEDAIADPEIGVSPFEATDPIPEGACVHHLRLKGDYTQGSQPFFIQGMYKSFLHHLWLEGNHCFTADGFTKSRFEDIVSLVHCVTASDNLGIELKSGSYKSSCERIKCTIVNEDANTTYFTLNSIGERSRGIRLNDIEILAPSVNAQYLISQSSAVRLAANNIRYSGKNLSYALSLQGSGSTHILPTANNVSNIRVRLSGNYAVPVNFSDSSASNDRGDDVSNVHIDGTSATVNSVSPKSLIFGAVKDCYARSVIADGSYSATGSATNCHMYDCVTGGPDTPATRASVIEHECLTTGTLALPAPTQVFNTTVTSTSANHVVGTLTVPANYPWKQGDKIKWRIAGLFTGTTSTKNVAIADGSGALYTLTVASGVTDQFQIEATACVITATDPGNTIGYRLVGLSVVGATVTSFQNLTTPASNTTVPFYIQAWVANALDSVIVWQGEIQFSRQEDSISAGATDARS